MDTNAIMNTIRQKIKSGVLGKSRYGKHWDVANDNWYQQIHDSNDLLHEDFQEFLQSKNDIKTVLEVGCGTGIYPIKHKDLFSGMEYTGIDFSNDAINYCKKNSNFNFIQGDFIKMELPKQYDLIYSHAVVDHVYNIDAFIEKIAKNCIKYAYINAYRGYFPDLTQHRMNWRDDDGCYYNDVSIQQIRNTLLRSGLREDELVIRKQQGSTKEDGIKVQTVIIINKKIK